MNILNEIKRIRLSEKAYGLVVKEKYTEALEIYNEICKLNDNIPEIYSNKFAILIKLHNFESALDCIDKLIQLEPDDANIFYQKACLLSLKEVQRHEEAIKYKSKQKFNLEFAYFIKSRIFALKNSKEECIEALSKAISIDINVKNKICDCEEFNNIKDDPYFKNIVD